MPKPSISIIVTNYNGYHIIKKSLPCILKNSPEASEIIFSDDASSDQSLLFVKKLHFLCIVFLGDKSVPIIFLSVVSNHFFR